MSPFLKDKLQEFTRDWGFDSYSIEEEGELVFFKRNEPFVIREFMPDSDMRLQWEELQDVVLREGIQNA